MGDSATGDSSFYKLAVTHANTTMKNHYRADYSSYHVINYNPETGAVQEKKTAQGFANESEWARGQAWGLYGFTVMYRETKDKNTWSRRSISPVLYSTTQTCLPIKYPIGILMHLTSPLPLRDASAAAIMASALLELCRYTDKKDGIAYFNIAQSIIKTLSLPHYMADAGTNGGFILQHSVGHFPAKTEFDQPLTYADYYFIEAMARYKRFATK